MYVYWENTNALLHYWEGTTVKLFILSFIWKENRFTKFFDNKGYHKMLQREKHLQVNVKIQQIFAIESKINVKRYTLIFFISLSKKYLIIFRLS